MLSTAHVYLLLIISLIVADGRNGLQRMFALNRYETDSGV
jgi:hypothetical protein